MTECDIAIIVRSPGEKIAVLNGLTEQGEGSILEEVELKGAKLSFFRNHDGRRVGIIVSASKDPRARMDRMYDVANKTGCTCVILIKPEYTAQDLKRRRIDLPNGCMPMFVEELDMFLDVLGYDANIGALSREVLKPLFTPEQGVHRAPEVRAAVPIQVPPPAVRRGAGTLLGGRPSRAVDVEDQIDEDMGVMMDAWLGNTTPVSTSQPRSTIRAGPGSTILSNVSLDAATFRSIMESAPGRGPNISGVTYMPATEEEEDAVAWVTLPGGRRVVPPTRADIRPPPRLVNDMAPRPRFHRAVPSAATVRLSPPPRGDLEDEDTYAARMYPLLNSEPLVPAPRNPPQQRNWTPMDPMDPWIDRMLRENAEWEANRDRSPSSLPHFPGPQAPAVAPDPPVTERPAWLQDMTQGFGRAQRRLQQGTPVSLPRLPPRREVPAEPAMPPEFQAAIQLARQVDAQVAEEREAQSSGAGRPMTSHERRLRSRRRVEEQGQQQVVTRLVTDKKVKAAMAPREEDPNIGAMCTTAEDNTCTICMESHITTLVLPCNHMLFCHGCISKWVDAHGNCPTCKTAVVTTVQPRTKFDAPNEHKRRRLETEPGTAPEANKHSKARRKEVAELLRKEAAELEAGVEPE